MKKIFTLLLTAFAGMLAYGQSTTLVISQVYGGAGCGTPGCSTYQNDFIEIFNKSSSPISLGGYSVQYAAATGTGTWQVTTLPSVTLNPGQYFLVAQSFGTNGVNPLPTPDATGTLAMSATAGKVALVSSTTALSGSQCPTASATVVDLVGYGATANCSEGGAPTPAPSTTTALFRASGGCQDTQNNGTDFTAAAPAPRNTASATNSCGAPSAVISATPNITNMTTSVGVVSASQSYTLSGTTLSPAAGNITVTPSAGLEVSLDNTSFSSGLTVPYSGGALAATPVYVRITNAAPQGAVSGTVDNSGGGASTATVTVSGGVFQNFYSKSTGTLDVLGTWGTATNGGGSAPASFTGPYQVFNVVNQTTATIGGAWDFTATGTRAVVGDGTNPITLIVPAGAAINSNSRIDVSNNAVLQIINNTRPFLNNLATGSTVDFAQTGTTTADTIRFPAISYYNLKATGGLKYFSSGTTTVRGNFIADGVVSMNGAGSPFSTVNAFGNLTFTNGTQFESVATGDIARITLAMNGAAATQTITGNGTDLLLFRLRRDSTNSSIDINLGAGTNLVLGNNSGGGLQLNQGGATTTTLNKGNNNLSLIGAAISTNSSNGVITSTGGNIVVNKTVGTSNAGTLRFSGFATADQFIVNFDPSITRDSITVTGNLNVVSSLTLTQGRVVMTTPAELYVRDGGIVSGGSASSFVDGRLRIQAASGTNFPVGKGTRYAPVQIANMNGFNNYAVQYFSNGYGNYAIDPTTLATYPGYNVSGYEYWIVDQGNPGGTCDVTFNYTTSGSLINTPSAVRIAHFDGADWNDIGGTPAGGNTTSNGSVTVTGVSAFSPFTFSAATGGVIPVRLASFTVQKKESSVKVSWSTAQEINSAGFEIERSADGRNWTSIASIAAAGNSNTVLNYSITDNQPLRGMNFYRLKLVDRDGRIEYSLVKTVLFGSRDEVLIAPNPATDFINVYLSKVSTAPIQISLMNVNGKLIKTISTTEQQARFAAQGLAKGLYVVKVTNAGETTIHKVMVQ